MIARGGMNGLLPQVENREYPQQNQRNYLKEHRFCKVNKIHRREKA